MPRPRLPPTPSSSTDIVGKEKSSSIDMEGVFTLPPAAVSPRRSKAHNSRSHARIPTTGQSSPPLSPDDMQIGFASQRKRTLSGAGKHNTEVQSSSTQITNTALPPPPSRARKIIQMKPNQTASNQSQQQAQATSKEDGIADGPATKNTTASRKKQAKSSITSAAGRKIARKTAHSIIERRRRSKMNEEFGVLKDMIPACAGIEMHKLAILQAGIEYVKYLEGCIEQLKTQPESSQVTRDRTDENSAPKDNEEDGSMDVDDHFRHHRYRLESSSAATNESAYPSPTMETRLASLKSQKALPPLERGLITGGVSNSAYVSPELRPLRPSPSQSIRTTYSAARPQTHTPAYTVLESVTCSTSPPPLTTQTLSQTGISPAFGAFQFSPDLSRTSTWSSINGQNVCNASPNILPLPQSALPVPLPLPASVTIHGLHASSPTSHGEGHAEATATAALMMMTTDRRASTSYTKTSSGKGMSVKDLLTS